MYLSEAITGGFRSLILLVNLVFTKGVETAALEIKAQAVEQNDIAQKTAVQSSLCCASNVL